MKKIFLIVCFLSCLTTFAQYKYMGNDISQEQLEKLYSAFGKYVYFYDNNTYDFSTEDPDRLKQFKGADPDIGVVFVKINSINKNRKEITADRIDDTVTRRINQTGKRCVIINADCENLKSKAEIPVIKLDRSKINNPSLTPSSILLGQASPANIRQFAEYLAKGGVCYEYKRITPEFVTCDTCRGTGRVYLPPRNDRNNSIPEYSICSKCNGTGKVEPTVIQYEKNRISLKQ